MAMTISGSNGITFPNSTTQAAASSMVLIASATASNSATIDFTNISNTTYNAYRIYVTNAIPSSSSVNLLLRGSTGGSWISSLYTWRNWRYVAGGSGPSGQDATGTGIPLNSTSEPLTTSVGGSFIVDIYNTANSGYKAINSQGMYYGVGTTQAIACVSGGWISGSQTIDGFRFLMDGGNIASGTFYLYGIV